MMKNINIDKFGTKLLAVSKSINKIPNYFLKISQNARIYDGGIWPAPWKIIHTNSTLWTNNKGGFVLNGKLYQIANSKIYEIWNEGTQTEKATLWYDERVDILVYDFITEKFSSW